MGDDLKRLLAKQEITEALYLYCRAMDRSDHALGKRIWHPDGLAEYGAGFKGTGVDFVDFVIAHHERSLLQHTHEVSNIVILVDGDTATSESYVVSAQRRRENGQLKEDTHRGRYLDKWSYRNGRWAIDSRFFVHEFSDVRDVTELPAVSPARRSQADPSYGILKGL